MWFFVSCCFLPLSSIHDVVTVWQPPEPSEKHKHWLNTQFAGGLWERICSYTQGIVSPRCCIPCCSLLSSSPPWPNWTGHWHLVCLSLKCDSGLLVSSCTVSFHVLLMTHRHFLSWYVSPPPPFCIHLSQSAAAPWIIIHSINKLLIFVNRTIYWCVCVRS